MEEESEDSLDLLLDTLCNAFGGIILITLLIALMSQEANNEPAVPTNFRTQWLLEQQEVSRIENALIIEDSIGENLEAKIKGEELNEAAVSIREKQRLERQKQTISGNLDRLREELAHMPTNSTNLAVDLQNQLERLIVLNEENSKIKSKLQSRIKDMEIKLSDAQDGISSSKSERTQPLRLPKEKGKSSKGYVWVIVKHGMIYPNHYLYKKIFNRVEVGAGATKYIPREGKGLDVTTNPGSVINFLNRVDKKNQYLAFMVYSNDKCFRAFNMIKQIATKKEIGYTWEPKTPGEDIIFSSTGRGAGSEL